MMMMEGVCERKRRECFFLGRCASRYYFNIFGTAQRNADAPENRVFRCILQKKVAERFYDV